MKSNIIMQSNNGKHRERTISSVLFDARTLILTLVITMTMVMGTAFFTNTAQAVSGSGATVRVATFDQLNDALGNGGVSDIIIDPQAAEEFADNEGTEISFDGSDVFYIPIEYPLVVSHDVTISSEVAVNFARSGNGGSGKYDSKAFKGQNEVTPALFNVDQGKTLVLEGDIAMTGEEVSATFDSAQGSFLFTVKARDNLDDEDDEDDNDAWSYGSDPGKLSTGGYFIYTKGGNVVMNDGILLMGLNTKDNVKDIAPVYIDGTAKAATLTVEGAEIVDNNLGQTEEGKSTAGAVILKGENATAALNSGEISNNNADVAGIIVKEEAELELGNDFAIEDNDIYDEKAEEAAKEEAAKEETAEEEATKEETEEAPIVVAPKKSLKSSKSSAVQMKSQGSGTNTTVKSSLELKNALKNKVNPIILDSSLQDVDGKYYIGIDEPLTVGYAVEIRTANKDAQNKKEIILARTNKFADNATDPNPAIFNVSSNGDLTLSEKVTMSGVELTLPRLVKLDLKAESKYFGVTGQYFDCVNESSGSKLAVNSSGYLMLVKDNGTEVRVAQNFRYIEGAVPMPDKDYRLTPLDDKGVPTGTPATALEAGRKYVAYTSVNGGVQYMKYVDNPNPPDLGRTATNDYSNAIVFTAEAVSGTGDDALKVENTVWTDAAVKEGGYFIQVNGGKVTINNGVTLKDLTTDTSVKNVAPVVVKGDSRSSVANDGRKNFVMNGGSIEGNKVGYMGDSLDSTKAVKEIANAIKGSDGTGKSNMTNTAGGVIFTDKATATIAGGQIKGNKGDAGGIIVTEEAHVKFTSGKLNSNIGVHHAGAAHVEHGGTLVMDGVNAEMKDNIAWYKGGAVWATEWGTSGYAVADWSKWPREFPTLIESRSKRSDKGGGNFVLKNGTIQNNTAFARAGAIEVESNGVQLDGGLIDSNYCRSLGGAIYIEGDSPNYSYALVLPKGYITSNTAVFKTPNSSYKADNALLDRNIGDTLREIKEDGVVVGETWLENNSSPGDNSDKDFNGAMGNGGGIWLCPVGGTSVFTCGDIYIWDNDAERNKGGEDFYLHRGNGAAMLQSSNLQGNWKNEVTNASVAKDMGVVSGPLSMTNETNYSTGSNGVVITNNIARDGGAIACNGTFIIGEAEDVHRFNSRIDMTKTWAEGTEPSGKTINLKLQYKSKDGDWKDLKYVNAGVEGVYSVDLNGTASGDSGVNSDIIAETTDAGSTNVWKATAFLPLYVMEGNEKTFLYTLVNPKKSNYQGETGFDSLDELDLSNEKHVGHLYKYIDEEKKAGRTPSIQVANNKWNLRIVETLKVGNKTYKCEIAYPETGEGSGYAETITLNDPIEGGLIDSFQITYSTVSFGASLTNSLNDLEIELHKRDNFGKGIQGVEFVLCEAHQDNGGDYRFAGDENAFGSAAHDKTYNDSSVKTASETSGNNGYLKFTGVKPGKTYFLFENSNPDPVKYQDHTAPWLIKVDDSGDYTVHAIQEDKKNKAKKEGHSVIDYSDKKVHYRWWDDDWFSTTSSNILENEWKPFAHAKLVKTSSDGETPLPGAKFAFGDVAWTDTNTKTDIYSGSGGIIKNGNQPVIIETGDDGVINLTNVIRALSMTNNPGGLQGTHIEDGKIVLLMYEVKPGNVHKTKTAPWLLIIEENGDVTVKEYKNPYIFSKSPVSENGTWQHSGNVGAPISDFGQTDDAVTTGTLTDYAAVKNEPAEFKLTKVGSESTEQNTVKLDGAEFKLYKAKASDYKSNGEPRGTFTITDKNPIVVNPTTGSTVIQSKNGGVINLPIPAPGEYILYETKAPTGYKRSVVPWGIWVKSDNTVVGYPIKVAKLDELETWLQTAGNDPLDIPLTCEHFDLPSEYIKNDKLNVELTKTNLNSTPLNDAVFELYKVTNLPTNTSVSDIIDADWTTNSVTNNWDMEKLAANRVGSNVEIKSKDGGKISLPITTEGVYFLFETTAAPNYKVPSDPWVVVVDEYGKVVVRKSDGSAKNGDRWWRAKKYTKLSGTSITNERLIELTKVNSMDSSKPVVGAKFVITRVGDGNDYFVAGTRYQKPDNQRNTGILATDSSLVVTIDGKTSFETNNQGKISFTAPAPGKYFIFEYDPSPGYNLAKSPWLMEVSENYDVTVKAINANQYGKYTTGSTHSSSTDRNPLLVYNTWWSKSWYDGSQSSTTLTNEPIYIKKTGEGTDASGLAGAKFSIWTVSYQMNSSGVSAIKKNQNLNDTYGEDAFVSDANGKIDISPLYNHLTTDNYTRFLIYEESAAEGYLRPKAPWLIVINNSDLYDVSLWANGQPNTDFGSSWINYNNYCNATATLKNTKDPTALYKKDADSLSTLINGAKFDLYAANKKQNCYWTGNWWNSRYVCEDILDDDGKHIVTRGNLIKGGIESGKNTDKGKIDFGSDIILPDGYLLLYETDAADKYIKPYTPWIIEVENHKIKDIYECKIPYQDPYVNHDANTEWKLKDFESTGVTSYITNNRIYNLPKSGGMGTYWFMIIGAMMMGFALTAGFTKMDLKSLLRR